MHVIHSVIEIAEYVLSAYTPYERGLARAYVNGKKRTSPDTGSGIIKPISNVLL